MQTQLALWARDSAIGQEADAILRRCVVALGRNGRHRGDCDERVGLWHHGQRVCPSFTL